MPDEQNDYDDAPSLEDILFAMSGWPEVEEALQAWEERQSLRGRQVDGELSEEFLLRAIRHRDGAFREIAARSGHWSREVMDIAVGDHYADVRYVAACSPSTAPEGLVRLATDTSINVRAGVASNPSTPVTTLLELLDDSNESVRRFAVYQHRFPADVMERLSHSDDPEVLRAVATSPNTAPATLDHLARSMTVGLWAELIDNHNTPAASLELIPDTPRPHLHQGLLKHPNASDALCRRLARRYLDEADAPLRLAGLNLMFRGPVRVAPWGTGRTGEPVPAFDRPSDVVVWLAEGADLSTTVPYALDTANPDWLRWFILSRAQPDHSTWVRLATDHYPRLRELALRRLGQPSPTPTA